MKQFIKRYSFLIFLILFNIQQAAFALPYVESKPSFLFHGSKNGNLKTIKPFKSAHNKHYVYATHSLPTAALFIADWTDYDITVYGAGLKDKPLVLVERYEGALNRLKGAKGFVYRLPSSDFSQATSWSAEWVAKNSVPVNKRIVIHNVYNVLRRGAEIGTVKIYQYPNRPKRIPIDDADLIHEAKHYNGYKIMLRKHPKLANHPKMLEYAKHDKRAAKALQKFQNNQEF